jgi:hypothetical protein
MSETAGACRLFHLTTAVLRCGDYAQALQFCAGSLAERRVLIAAEEYLADDSFDENEILVTVSMTKENPRA